MLLQSVVVAAILLYHCVASDHQHTICVYQGENACDMCSENYTDVSQILYPVENFTIKICSYHFKLNTLIRIEGNYSVTIEGLPSIFQCGMFKSGLSIQDVNELFIKNIALISCGAFHDYKQVASGIFIFNCVDVTVENLRLTSSQETGLALLENTGNIVIDNCTFETNGNQDIKINASISSGLYIEISQSSRKACNRESTETMEGVNNYFISNCSFSGNNGSSGGGLCLLYNGSSVCGVPAVISGCSFSGNSAYRGGAVSIEFLDDCSNNSVTIESSIFMDNIAEVQGGGLNVGFSSLNQKHPVLNLIKIENCLFCRNKAQVGGGISYYSSSSEIPDLLNTIIFQSCNWTKNTAQFGAAVDLTPQISSIYIYNVSDKILFRDCIFESNAVTNNEVDMMPYVRGKGTFISVGYNVNFEGNIQFHLNNGSALYLTSTRLDILPGTTIEFTNNSGFQGGAIYMLGFSVLALHEDSHLTFRDNVAENLGGAIYHLNGDKVYIKLSHICFFVYVGTKEVKDRNVTVIIQNNSVIRHSDGDKLELSAIYATTVLPCYRACNNMDNKNISYTEVFKCVGRFTFENGNAHYVSTDVSEIKIISNVTKLMLIPGKIVQLPVEAYNDMGETIDPDYHVLVQNSSKVTVSSQTSNKGFILNRKIQVFGNPNDRAVLQLATTTVRETVIELPIAIQYCPPGFTFQHKMRECVCMTQKFITECDKSSFSAKLVQGYWMGYDENSETEESLLFSHCPYSHCNVPDQDGTLPFLPNTSSLHDLNETICGATRTGLLCSRCRKGYAIHYHDYQGTCINLSKSYCNWGWFFYLISEILPVTVLFCSLMIFNIKLTSGDISGFILYCQISTTFSISGNGFIPFNNSIRKLLNVYYGILAGLWNLRFFDVKEMSFCLWSSANLLDHFAIRYITILYSLLLVMTIVAMFKYCHIPAKLRISTKHTIIHGISGFLILCYSVSVNVSRKILTSVKIKGFCGEQKIYDKHTVPFFAAHLNYFQGNHLYYAIPSLLILFFLGILPPLILLSYPLCYKVFSIFRVAESKFVSILCTIIPLQNFKPFFDSFQYSFKDEYRFFSGLYFLYRFNLLLTFAIADFTKLLYAYIEIQLILMLTVHAICQPYKKRWHNVLDTLLFMNLTIVNTITLVNYYHTVNFDNHSRQYYINIGSSIQLILLYTPIIYITINVSRKTVRKLKQWKKKRVNSEPNDYHELTDSIQMSRD